MLPAGTPRMVSCSTAASRSVSVRASRRSFSCHCLTIRSASSVSSATTRTGTVVSPALTAPRVRRWPRLTVRVPSSVAGGLDRVHHTVLAQRGQELPVQVRSGAHVVPDDEGRGVHLDALSGAGLGHGDRVDCGLLGGLLGGLGHVDAVDGVRRCGVNDGGVRAGDGVGHGVLSLVRQACEISSCAGSKPSAKQPIRPVRTCPLWTAKNLEHPCVSTVFGVSAQPNQEPAGNAPVSGSHGHVGSIAAMLRPWLSTERASPSP